MFINAICVMGMKHYNLPNGFMVYRNNFEVNSLKLDSHKNVLVQCARLSLYTRCISTHCFLLTFI